jgi:glycosyltransferase involved in cell wall biosynthesis
MSRKKIKDKSKIKATPKNVKKLACCMMVKNEARTIEKVIIAYKDVVDVWWIIVDDSTKDQTFEIAKRHTKNVFHFTWENNFAKSRNDGIDALMKAHPDVELLLIMDGHDFPTVSTIARIKYYKEHGFPHKTIKAICAHFYTNLDEFDSPGIIIPQERILHPSVRYRRAANNEPDLRLEEKIVDHHLIVLHRRPKELEKERLEQIKKMNYEIYTKEYEEGSRELIMLGAYSSLLYFKGEYDKAIKVSMDMIRAATDSVNKRYEGYLMIARAYMQKAFAIPNNDVAIFAQECRKFLYDAMYEDVFRAETYCELGELALHLNKTIEAELMFKFACECNVFVNSGTINGPAYTWLPHKRLFDIYIGMNKLRLAVMQGEIVCNYRPLDALSRNQVQRLQEKLGIDGDWKV